MTVTGRMRALCIGIWFSAAACAAPHGMPVPARASMSEESFGRLPSGVPVRSFTLTNAHGVEVRAISYGAIIQSIRTPDRAGVFADVVLGYDDLAGYVKDSPYFGAVVGRYGNRIAGGRFTLDGNSYTLARNNGPNHLHGGPRGFDKVVWEAAPFARGDERGVTFRYLSANGEEGYPGALQAQVTYTLTDRDELVVEYLATTDAPTHLNLTQHSYFNLRGDSGDVLGHLLSIDADRYTPVDSTLIPSGELAAVADTPFDFRAPAAIGARIGDSHTQLRYGGGYDHNWVLNGTGLRHVVHVAEPGSGRTLDVATTEPGLQFYSGNFLDGSLTGKGGRVYRHRTGFCLETQHFPDSPNHPGFPSTVLRPGNAYRSRTVFTFGTGA